MKKYILSILVILLFFTDGAAEITGGKILKHGIYTAINVRTEKAEGTAIGEITMMKDMEFVENTTKIPAAIGNRFGIMFVINGTPDGEQIIITVRWINPQMKNPKKDKAFQINKWTQKAKIGSVTGTGYRFEEEWELLPGEWTVHIIHEDQKLLEKTFTVYLP